MAKFQPCEMLAECCGIATELLRSCATGLDIQLKILLTRSVRVDPKVSDECQLIKVLTLHTDSNHNQRHLQINLYGIHKSQYRFLSFTMVDHKIDLI